MTSRQPEQPVKSPQKKSSGT